MKLQQILIIGVTAILTIQSCSYTRIRVERNGKKYWIRRYKDHEKQTQYEDTYIFKHWKRNQTYSKYSGQISNDTPHTSMLAQYDTIMVSSMFVQFDSIRVYLFGGTDKYKSIFTSGLLSGQLIYCKLDSTCKPPVFDGGNLWGWTGHTIIIDYFEELKNVKSLRTQRRFRLGAYPYKTYFIGSSQEFLLELTNNKAKKDTNLETFIKDASVTFLVRGRSRMW